MSLAVGTLGVDYSGFRMDTAAKVADAKKANGKFIVRYSAGRASSPSDPSYDDVKWKLITPAEFKALVADGFDIIANSEWYETRITEGATAGRQDGAADLALWKSCGLAKGSVIIVSWDTAPSSSQYNNVQAYLAAYDAALAGYYEVGMYAGSAAIAEMRKRGVITCGWQTMSTSWSNNNLPYQPSAAQIAAAVKAPPAGIDLWQTGNYWFSKNADENVVLRAGIMSHNTAKGGATPAPKPKPTPVKPAPKPVKPAGGTYTIRPSDSDGLIAVCKRHSITDWKSVATLNHIAAPNYVIHVGDVLKWPGGKAPAKPAPVKKATHKVVSGDSISSIASAWGVTPQAVEKANPKAGHPAGDFNNIWPGDVITHP